MHIFHITLFYFVNTNFNYFKKLILSEKNYLNHICKQFYHICMYLMYGLSMPTMVANKL